MRSDSFGVVARSPAGGSVAWTRCRVSTRGALTQGRVVSAFPLRARGLVTMLWRCSRWWRTSQSPRGDAGRPCARGARGRRAVFSTCATARSSGSITRAVHRAATSSPRSSTPDHSPHDAGPARRGRFGNPQSERLGGRRRGHDWTKRPQASALLHALEADPECEFGIDQEHERAWTGRADEGHDVRTRTGGVVRVCSFELVAPSGPPAVAKGGNVRHGPVNPPVRRVDRLSAGGTLRPTGRRTGAGGPPRREGTS